MLTGRSGGFFVVADSVAPESTHEKAKARSSQREATSLMASSLEKRRTIVIMRVLYYAIIETSREAFAVGVEDFRLAKQGSLRFDLGAVAHDYDLHVGGVEILT